MTSVGNDDTPMLLDSIFSVIRSSSLIVVDDINNNRLSMETVEADSVALLFFDMDFARSILRFKSCTSEDYQKRACPLIKDLLYLSCKTFSTIINSNHLATETFIKESKHDPLNFIPTYMFVLYQLRLSLLHRCK